MILSLHLHFVWLSVSLMQICFVESCMHGPMRSTEHKQRWIDDWEMGPSILWVLSIRCHDQIMKCRDGPDLECWKGSIQHFDINMDMSTKSMVRIIPSVESWSWLWGHSFNHESWKCPVYIDGNLDFDLKVSQVGDEDCSNIDLYHKKIQAIWLSMWTHN